MSEKTLSVIICNYNHGHYIKEALVAILNQSFSPTEVIVVDDGSTDNSVALINRLMERYQNLRFLQNEKNMGVLYSVNRALDSASGDYIYSAACDDRVLPGLFEKSIKLLSKYPQAGLCCSDHAIHDSRHLIENKLHLSENPSYFNPAEVINLFMREAYTPIHSQTVIIKRSALIEAGGYIPDLKWSCDAFAQSVVSFRYGMCYLPEVLAMARMHPNQYGGLISRDWRKENEIIKKMLNLLRTTKYCDVLPAFKQTAAFSCSPWEVFRMVVSSKENYGFFSYKLLRFALLDKIMKRTLLRILPYHTINFSRKFLAKIRRLKSLVGKI